jgi:hypothetical protein
MLKNWQKNSKFCCFAQFFSKVLVQTVNIASFFTRLVNVFEKKSDAQVGRVKTFHTLQII